MSENTASIPWSRLITGFKYNSDGTPNLGHISDGYHTFDELYEHRTVLLASLMTIIQNNDCGCNCWRSNFHSDGTMYDGMFIVGIATSSGTVTYHIENEYKYLFSNILELPKAPDWDGSTPQQGLEKLIKSIIKAKK